MSYKDEEWEAAEKNKSNKKSEWIEIPRYGGDFFSKCPKCGALEIAQTNFCPECGEPMRINWGEN